MTLKTGKKYENTANIGTVEEKNFAVPLFQEQLLSLDDDGGEEDVCYLVTSSYFHSDDKAFGEELITKFFMSLNRQHLNPTYIIFIDNGVYLALENSIAYEELSLLEKDGTIVISSEESLDFYCPNEKVGVGRKSSMNNITMILHTVNKVITL